MYMDCSRSNRLGTSIQFIQDKWQAEHSFKIVSSNKCYIYDKIFDQTLKRNGKLSREITIIPVFLTSYSTLYCS